MDEPATLIRSSSCDVKTCSNNENTVKAQAKEMGEVLKGWPLNPFKAYPPAWFRKAAGNRIFSKFHGIYGLIRITQQCKYSGFQPLILVSSCFSPSPDQHLGMQSCLLRPQALCNLAKGHHEHFFSQQEAG